LGNLWFHSLIISGCTVESEVSRLRESVQHQEMLDSVMVFIRL
jgi:hypothetical protein